MISSWREYQERAAAFFACLGAEVEVDARVQGVRASHRVDVLVGLHAFGLDNRWIVECKDWNRRIGKHAVLTLKGVVDDVGADRGFLLSEKGFQPAAVSTARMSNLTLTNLGQLSQQAELDVLALRQEALERRVLALLPHLGNLAPLNVTIEEFRRAGSAELLLNALHEARLGRLTRARSELDRFVSIGSDSPPPATAAEDLRGLVAEIEAHVIALESWRDSLGESSVDLLHRVRADPIFRARLFDELADAARDSAHLDDSWLGLDLPVPVEELRIVDLTPVSEELRAYGGYVFYGTPLWSLRALCRAVIVFNIKRDHEPLLRKSHRATVSHCEISNAGQAKDLEVRIEQQTELDFEVALEYPSGELKKVDLGRVTLVLGAWDAENHF